jgi:hypothetical protein
MACAAQVPGSHSGRHASVMFTSLDLVSLPKDRTRKEQWQYFEWESPRVNPGLCSLGHSGPEWKPLISPMMLNKYRSSSAEVT